MIRFVSPSTHAALTSDGNELTAGEESFPIIEGIPHLVRPERRAAADAFASAYERVRSAEGRGSTDAAFHRALPDVPTGTPFAEQWRHRAASFGKLLGWLDRHRGSRLLDIVDLGAGNCWMAARLADRGHRCIAVDVNVGDVDGLAAHVHHGADITVARAELDALPLEADSIDLAVGCASVHYMVWDDLCAEIDRVLRPDGVFVIFDSPAYSDPSSGERMVTEQDERLANLAGAAAMYDGPGYLTFHDLDRGSFAWQITCDDDSFADRARRLWTRVRVGREPARMPFLVGTQLATATRHRPDEGQPT